MNQNIVIIKFAIGSHEIECSTDMIPFNKVVKIKIDGKDIGHLGGNVITAADPDIERIVADHIVREYMVLTEIWRQENDRDDEN